MNNIFVKSYFMFYYFVTGCYLCNSNNEICNKNQVILDSCNIAENAAAERHARWLIDGTRKSQQTSSRKHQTPLINDCVSLIMTDA